MGTLENAQGIRMATPVIVPTFLPQPLSFAGKIMIVRAEWGRQREEKQNH